MTTVTENNRKVVIAVAALILWSTVSVTSHTPAPPAAPFIMDVAQRVGFR